MSDLKDASKAKFFCSILYNQNFWSPEQIVQELSRLECGEVESLFGHGEYDLSRYYAKQMGESLKRFFVSFCEIRERDFLIDLKIKCDSLEKEYTKESMRSVNIDPGFVAMEHMILATGKPYAHRPYLGKGVYAELTYQVVSGKMEPLPWSYPDYKLEKVIHEFELLRICLKNQQSP